MSNETSACSLPPKDATVEDLVNWLDFTIGNWPRSEYLRIFCEWLVQRTTPPKDAS